MIALFEAVYILVIIGIILLKCLSVKKREFRGAIGNVLYVIKLSNILTIVFWILYNAIILAIFGNVVEDKSMRNIIVLTVITATVINIIFKYSKKSFVSTLGIGYMTPLKCIYDFEEWEKIKDWYIERCNNKNRYILGIRLNENKNIIMWQLDEKEKDEVQKIFIKYKKNQGILL